MLKLQFLDGSREGIWLVESRTKIGKHPTNSVVINHPNMQDFHAEIVKKDPDIFILNLNPEYVVGVNGKRIQKAAKIKENDIIQLGKVKIKLAEPSTEVKSSAPASDLPQEWGLQTSASWAPQSFYPVENTCIVGRDESCDITVPVSHLSRQHAQLTVAGGYMIIKDLGSTNGTFLNGERITQGRARPGDKIKFDVVSFTVTGPESDGDKTIVRPGTIAAAPIAEAPKQKSATPVSQSPPASAASAPASAAKPTEQPEKSKTKSEPEALEPVADTTKKTSYLLYTIVSFIVVLGALSAVYFMQK